MLKSDAKECCTRLLNLYFACCRVASQSDGFRNTQPATLAPAQQCDAGLPRSEDLMQPVIAMQNAVLASSFKASASKPSSEAPRAFEGLSLDKLRKSLSCQMAESYNCLVKEQLALFSREVTERIQMRPQPKREFFDRLNRQ